MNDNRGRRPGQSFAIMFASYVGGHNHWLVAGGFAPAGLKLNTGRTFHVDPRTGIAYETYSAQVLCCAT